MTRESVTDVEAFHLILEAVKGTRVDHRTVAACRVVAHLRGAGILLPRPQALTEHRPVPISTTGRIESPVTCLLCGKVLVFDGNEWGEHFAETVE